MTEPSRQPAQADVSTAELLNRLTEQSTMLVRDEVALAKLEMTEKANRLGLGAGLFSAAGVLSFFGAATLIAAAVLGLAEGLPAWLSALIVALVLFLAAGIAALVGKKRIEEGTPPLPTEAIENVKLDLAEVKEARHRDH